MENLIYPRYCAKNFTFIISLIFTNILIGIFQKENWDSETFSNLYTTELGFQPMSEWLQSLHQMTMHQDRNDEIQSITTLHCLGRSNKVAALQVLNNEIWSPTHIMGSVFQKCNHRIRGQEEPQRFSDNTRI